MLVSSGIVLTGEVSCLISSLIEGVLCSVLFSTAVDKVVPDYICSVAFLAVAVCGNIDSPKICNAFLAGFFFSLPAGPCV